MLWLHNSKTTTLFFPDFIRHLISLYGFLYEFHMQEHIFRQFL